MNKAIRYGIGICLAWAAAGTWANSQLALDQGCFSCHGDPPRTGMPTFSQLAARYARYQGVSEAEVKLADKLRQKPLFGGITAHECLSEDSARILIRWIIQGAP